MRLISCSRRLAPTASPIESSLGLFWVCFAALLPAPAWAGPNAAGTLVAHDAHLAISATSSSLAICLQGDTPADCGGIDARVDGIGQEQLIKIYALFPSTSGPRLATVSWGLRYDPSSLSLAVAQGSTGCADFQVADDGWPGPGTGCALAWNSAQTSLVVPVYAFGALAYSPTSLELAPDPSEGGTFGDDSQPAQLDPIAGYGVLGFDQPGSAPCPPGVAGACCDPSSETCTQRTFAECSALPGGLYVGAEVECSPGTCTWRGACCDPGDFCLMNLTYSECIENWSGVFLGIGTDCLPGICTGHGACCRDGACTVVKESDCLAPALWCSGMTCLPRNPCLDDMGACCDSTACVIRPESGCADHLWLRNASCSPDPCSPQLGACCIGTACAITTSEECPEFCGVFQPDAPCGVDGATCAQPLGACCYLAPCRVTTREDCPEASQFWFGGMDCRNWGDYPPCVSKSMRRALPQVAGACCMETGRCLLMLPNDCAAARGTYQGACSECRPDLCPDLPTRPASWGRIKYLYR